MLASMRRAAGLCLLLVMSACGEDRCLCPRRRRSHLSQAPPSVLRSRFQA